MKVVDYNKAGKRMTRPRTRAEKREDAVARAKAKGWDTALYSGGHPGNPPGTKELRKAIEASNRRRKPVSLVKAAVAANRQTSQEA